MTREWTLTYLGDEWRWDSEPYGRVVSVVGWAWRRELKDAGEELPQAVNSEDGDSGLQSQELQAERGHVAPPQARGGSEPWIIPGRAVWWSLNRTSTARWRRDGGKGGETGRVGREVTGLTKWKELRLAVGHSSQNGLSVEARTSALLHLNLPQNAETQNNF